MVYHLLNYCVLFDNKQAEQLEKKELLTKKEEEIRQLKVCLTNMQAHFLVYILCVCVSVGVVDEICLWISLHDRMPCC